MKVRVGDRHSACDHYSRTDLDALRANKRSVCDVTVIADLDDGIVVSRERRAPDRCATPNTQSDLLLRVEMFEAERRIDNCLLARADIDRNASLEPVARQLHPWLELVEESRLSCHTYLILVCRSNTA